VCDPEALKPTLRIDIFTLFPAMFDGPFSESIVKRAIASGTIAIGIHDIREWATDKHRTADDTPYGGGAGMVIKAPPVIEAVESVLGDALESTRIAIMSAAGTTMSQSMAHELAAAGRVALICGHYEGIDQRVADILGAVEISIGDFVLTGGELPAMAIADATIRLVPGVIDSASIADESHSGAESQLVEYPHYTRPFTYRGHDVPEILLSGHHAKIGAWRREQAETRTARLRSDRRASRL
jgi:tRNA (guanine37-N1)-methyltransferase